MKTPRECAQQRAKYGLQTRGSASLPLLLPSPRSYTPTPLGSFYLLTPRRGLFPAQTVPKGNYHSPSPPPPPTGPVKLEAAHASRHSPHNWVTLDPLALGQQTMTSLGRPLIIIMK